MKKYFLILIITSIALTGCNHNKNITNKKYIPPQEEQSSTTNSNNNIQEVNFTGIRGDRVNFMNDKIEIDKELIEENIAKYFNVTISSGKVVYFFVVKDSSGIYRAAANACQVCHNAKMGFRQEGNNMICNTCGNAYPMEKIATEKGGCNPGPISPNLTVRGDSIIINQSDIAQVIDLF